MQDDLPSHSEMAVTAQECAPLVGCKPSSLYKMADAGIIPCLRTGLMGRGIRFIPSEVRAALKTRPAWVDPIPSKRGKKKDGTAV